MNLISINPSDTVGYGTIRPSRKEGPNWGKKALDNGFRNYCLLNPFTDKGLDKIAKFNSFHEEWEQEKQHFDENTTNARKRFINWKLYAKFRSYRCYHIEPIEGGHRRVGAIQAAMLSEIDGEEGWIDEPNTLSVNSFVNVGLKPKNSVTVADEDIIGAAMAVAAGAAGVAEGSLESGFYARPTTVQLTWNSDFDVPVPKYLSATRTVSFISAKNKRASATKDPMAEVGLYVGEISHLLLNDSLRYRPNLENHVYTKFGNKFPPKIGKGDLTEALKMFGKVSEAVPLLDFLYSDVLENYCAKPFDKKIRQKFIDHFECNVFDDDNEIQAGIKIKPPFVVSWKTAAVDAGLGNGERRVTAAMVNIWLFLPPIMHILFSHLQHQSLQQISDSKENINIILYTMRHHVHHFGMSNITGHHVMNLVYGMAFTENLANPQYCIILASLFIAEAMNAATTQIVKDKGEDLPVLKARKKLAFGKVQKVLYTTNKYSKYAPFPDVIEALGKRNLIYIL